MPGESTDAARGSSVWSAGRRGLAMGLVLTVSMAALESVSVATILPATTADIGGLELYGWAFSGFMLANLLGITAAGGQADRAGVATPFAAGVGLFVFGLLCAGAAGSMPVLVAGRVVQGFGAGAISAVSYVAVARGYAPAERPHMIALLSSAWVAPGLIGPALAGVVADHLSWRWVFLGLAPCTAAAATLALPPLRKLHASTPGADSAGAPHGEEHSMLAALALTAGAAALLYGLGLAPSAPAALLVIGGAALGVPALRRLAPDGTLRARRGLPAAIAVMGLLSAAFFAAEAFLPLLLTAIRGRSATVAGLALTAATVCWTAGAWVQARLAPARSRRAMVAAGLLLLVCGIAGTATVLSERVCVVVAALAWGGAGLGMGIAYSTTALVVLEMAPPGREGAASASMQLANVLGVALGTGFGGAIVALGTTAGRPSSLAIGAVDVVAIAMAMLALAATRGLPAKQDRC
jgi:MFS family permease